MVTVSELVTILDQYHSTDQVLGFKVIIKRNYSTSIQQSHNWPKLDDVSPQTSEQGESPENSGAAGGGHSNAQQANHEICPDCNGKGGFHTGAPSFAFEICDTCNGTGKLS